MPQAERSDLKERAKVMEAMAGALKSGLFCIDSMINLNAGIDGKAKAELIKYASNLRAAMTTYEAYKKKWENT